MVLNDALGVWLGCLTNSREMQAYLETWCRQVDTKDLEEDVIQELHMWQDERDEIIANIIANKVLRSEESEEQINNVESKVDSNLLESLEKVLY